MEFCQMQLNYLDWTLQNAKAKYDLLTERNIPVWVMEPVRGGRLANLTEEEAKNLKATRPDESAAAWGFRWLQHHKYNRNITTKCNRREKWLYSVEKQRSLR